MKTKLLFKVLVCSVLFFVSASYSQAPANDNFANATIVPHTPNWCSANAAYTTINATADGVKGSAWTNGPNYNVWFKFQATTTQVNAQVKIEGTAGTMRYPYIALWNSSGTEITSSAYYGSTNNINVQSTNLIVGNWYYISVDNHSNTSYRGTFSLCVEDKVDYDFKEAAIMVPHTPNWCSADAAYTTFNASPDEVKGSNWNTGPNFNRWFKFQATTTQVNAQVKIEGTAGTMRYPYIALWNSSGTEITSSAYYGSTNNINVQSTNLIVGNWYYISVDNHSNTSYRGTFSLCVEDKVDYDFKEAAIMVPHTPNWCSADAAYTTFNASPDEVKGSNWNTGPNFNRWFKFQATTTQVNAQVKIEGTSGTMRYPYIALWNSSGTEITSSAYYGSTNNINVQSTNLIVGNWYYISVDNHSNTSYRGTFSLCVEDKVDYDFKEAAIMVPHTPNWCSADAAYTTFNASPDEVKGSNWNTGPNFNRWFKFQATTTQVNAQVKIEGTSGTMRYPYIALWNSSGTEITSSIYISSTNNINVQSVNLIVGNWYYISVDNHSNSSYRGTFSLCVEDKVDYDYYERAIDVTSIINACSADAIYDTRGGSPDKNRGTSWNNSGPLYNRWFKFTAPATGQINVTVNVGGIKGSQGRTQLALWQADGITQISSDLYISNNDNVNLGATNLTPGTTYYISVDSFSEYYGTFTLCLQDKVDYDFYEGAIDVTSIINACSADAIYDTRGGSPDKNRGTSWNNSGPLYNRWFKFTAPATGQINITINVGGTKGTQGRTQLALWQANGITQISSDLYISNSDNVNLGATNLTPGTTYYISVDSFSGYYGTFTLCLQDKVDYDFYEGAIDVTSIINACSADAIYDTRGGSPDKNRGTTWNNSGPLYNRWFKFTAPAAGQITVTVNVGGTKGTQGRTQLALWQANGTTQVSSNLYTSNYDNVTLGATNLTPGATYYISVDAFSGYYGTFTLCLGALDYDFYEGAIDVTSLINSCSADAIYTTIGATPDKIAGNNWNNSGPKYNRWFKFTAPATGQINITVDIGGTKGTQRRTQIGLWKNGGVIEENSIRYVADSDDVVLSGVGLTPGATYYISVDAFLGYAGTFTLCLEQTFIDFNGSNYFVDFGNNHNFTGPFSLEAWIFPKSNSANATVISKGDVKTGALRGYHLSIKNGFANLIWYNNAGTAILNITSPHQITNNIWHHIATSYNGTQASLYLDGVLVASGNSTAPLNNGFSSMLGASYDSSTPTVPKNYFNGFIDEVRVWDVALSAQQIREMMNQEIVQNATSVRGKVIPASISGSLLWNNLKGYYPMTDNTAADYSGNKINGYSKNNRTSIQPQTAPLPYTSIANGDWDSATTWLNNTVQYIPNSTLYGTQIDWNIVRISNNVTANRSVKTLGLMIDATKTFNVLPDNLIQNSRYLEINGTIDLQGDSQLVQTNTSDLVTSASGKILRRQEGTSNAFRYNYWASPVGITSATSLIDNNAATNNPNNIGYKLNMLKDETGINMQFTSAYNQLGKLSTYWLYTYKNGLTYWDWALLSPTASLAPGIGYTQKGTGNASLQQQYIFEGKPNNGTILVNVTDVGGPGSVPSVSKTEYLLGNPYPSAIDIHKFIDDNVGVIDGSLNLWEQWAGDSHYLDEYKGGYAQVNKLGSCKAFQFIGINGAQGSQDGTKRPSRYLPVGQGFIVEIKASGTVKFNNSQRVFIKETDADGTYNNGSLFLKSSSTKSKGTSTTDKQQTSEMQKIRLEFNSVVGPQTRRELLLGFSDMTTDGFDYGYDALCGDTSNNDFNLSLEGQSMNMQAYSSITSDKVVPLNFKSSGNNTFEIKASEFENMDENQEVYLRDNVTGTYFDLKQNAAYRFTSAQGKFNTRFEMVFQSESKLLGIEETIVDNNFIFYQNATKTLFGKKLNTAIDKLAIINMNGQTVQEFNNVSQGALTNGLKLSNMASGAYVAWFQTETGQIITKKIIVN